MRLTMVLSSTLHLKFKFPLPATQSWTVCVEVVVVCHFLFDKPGCISFSFLLMCCPIIWLMPIWLSKEHIQALNYSSGLVFIKPAVFQFLWVGVLFWPCSHGGWTIFNAGKWVQVWRTETNNHNVDIQWLTKTTSYQYFCIEWALIISGLCIYECNLVVTSELVTYKIPCLHRQS